MVQVRHGLGDTRERRGHDQDTTRCPSKKYRQQDLDPRCGQKTQSFDGILPKYEEVR